MKLIAVAVIVLFSFPDAFSQSGCTDLQAVNYDPSAIQNDGSCIYSTSQLPLNIVTNLSSPLLDESSGLCFVNGKIWTHVDNTGNSLYHVDSLTGVVLDSVVIDAVNNDWEDIRVDGNYIYLGDFGNNWGNRTNLRVLRFPVASLDTSTFITPDEINFSYSDQTNFNIALNNNSFDCEAFFIYNDSVHLFTKDWINKITKHYVFPAVAGNHIAQVVDSFNVNGLVTSASINNDSLIVLIGYNNSATLPVFMWMMYDFKQSDFFSGNKRRFDMGSLINTGQVEGVDFTGQHNGMISSERFQQLSFNVPPRLQSFDLNPYLPTIPVSIVHALSHIAPPYPNPFKDYIVFDVAAAGVRIKVVDYSGRIIIASELTSLKLNLQSLEPGYYLVLLNDTPLPKAFTIIKE